MYAQIVRFQDAGGDLDDGIAHVLDEVVPDAEATPGVTGLWLVDRSTGERLSVMVFEDEAQAEQLFAKVGERRAADPDRNRPSPVGSTKYEVSRRPGSRPPSDEKGAMWQPRLTSPRRSGRHSRRASPARAC